MVPPERAKEDLAEASELAAKIAELRPGWWGGPALEGQIAELKDLTDGAIEHTSRPSRWGSTARNRQPATGHSLPAPERPGGPDRTRSSACYGTRAIPVEASRSDECRRAAIAKGDAFDGALHWPRRGLCRSSSNSSDHLTWVASIKLRGGRRAGNEFRRAVELGPGVPQSWLTYVQFLASAGPSKLDQARTVIAVAAKQLPSGPVEPFTLARCFMIVGDAKQAEGLVQKAQADYPSDPAALAEPGAPLSWPATHERGPQSLDVFEKLPNLLPERADLGIPGPAGAAPEHAAPGRPG